MDLQHVINVNTSPASSTSLEPDTEKAIGRTSSGVSVLQVAAPSKHNFIPIPQNPQDKMGDFRDVPSPQNFGEESKVTQSSPTVESRNNDVQEKFDAYVAALKASNKAPQTWYRWMFGSSEDNLLAEAEKSLRAVYSEQRQTEQVSAESKEHFCKQIIEAGGDSEVALEALAKGEAIPDPYSAQSIAERIKDAPTLLHEEVKKIVRRLSLSQINSIINDSSEEYLRELARKVFEQPETVAWLNTKQSLQEMLKAELYKMSYVVQDELSLDGSKALSTISSAFLQQPAPIEIQGLKNSGVDCYLSSALQCVRDIFSALPHERQQALLDSLSGEYQKAFSTSGSHPRLQKLGSPLAAFLEKKYDGRDLFAASFLRREIQRMMTAVSTSGIDSSGAAREIAESINPIKGESREQSDASQALLVLMERLNVPRAKIADTAIYRDSVTGTDVMRPIGEGGDQAEGLLIIPLAIPNSVTVQDTIVSNWDEEVSIEEGIIGSDGERHAFCKKRTLTSSPDSLTLSLNRFSYERNSDGVWGAQKLRTPILGLTSSVYFPTVASEEVVHAIAYAPSSIICHYGGNSVSSGHYATYRREGEYWFILNDDKVEKLTSLEELSGRRFQEVGIMDRGAEIMSHREFLECNAYIVNYRRIA